MNIDEITNEALRLTPGERAILAETIWESLEDPFLAFPDISEEESIKLAKLRYDEMENGNVTPISHQEMMNRLRRNEN